MKNNDSGPGLIKKFTRRNFLTSVGAATAGILVNPFKHAKNLHAYTHQNILENMAQVAVTQNFDYDRDTIKQKVQHLFEAIGGISDVAGSGDKVGVKINLTGGSSYAGHPAHQGQDIRDTTWTHPEVLRAVCELLLDSGVNPQDLYIVEAIWDAASYNNFGYKDIQDDLGLQLVNLNYAAPYDSFIDKETGENAFFWDSFKLNRILDDINVYVSIPKMKQHYDAGVTHTMKNQIGITPLAHYGSGWRSQLHFGPNGNLNIRSQLPRSILDLNLARPVHLGVVDGIKTAFGGEGPWNDTFVPIEYNLLLAGKDPVATDSICSLHMGNDPEAEKLQLPGGRSGNDKECDNYLFLAGQVGMGTNKLSNIELVGDGADLINSSVKRHQQASKADRFKLYENFPNPFNASTNIRYYLPRTENVSLKIFNNTGQEIQTLVNGSVSAGEHQHIWTVKNSPSGMYFVKLHAGRYTETRKLIYQK